jgi:hypothetical protein
MTVHNETPSPATLGTGRHGAYQWLSTTRHTIDDLLRVSPAVVLGKFLAVTSHDSGPLLLTDEQKSCGWVCRGEVAYSPRIESLNMVPLHGLYDEWYVFKAPAELGTIRNDFPVPPGRLEVFVNFGFAIDAPDMEDLVARFWQQLDWIRPEVYVAESDFGFLIFVTRDNELFASVCQAFQERPSES